MPLNYKGYILNETGEEADWSEREVILHKQLIDQKMEKAVYDTNSSGRVDNADYDGTAVGVAADNTQDAITEVAAELADVGLRVEGYRDYNADPIPVPAEVEGRVFYDQSSKSMAYYNDIANTTMNMGRELWLRGVNNTGTTLTNGTVVDAVTVAGGVPEFVRADADSYSVNTVIGVVTEDILPGEEGEATYFGKVNEFNTANLIEGRAVYLDIIAGTLTSDRPEFPAKAILIGGCLRSHATEGSIVVIIQEDTYSYEFDGCIVEKQDTFIEVVGTQVFMDVEKKGGGDLPIQLGSDVRILNCTTGAGVNGRARVELNQGTATTPQKNIVHIELNGELPELHAAIAYPVVPFAIVSTTSIRDHATVAVEGPDANRRSTSAINHDGRGRISYLTERWAIESPKYTGVGITPTATITNLATDVLDLSVLAGIVYQTHRQDFPSLTVSTDGVYVANGPGGANGLVNYTKYSNLTEVCGYVNADITRNTNCRGHLVVFGAVNKKTSECKLYVNLPDSLYGGNDTSAYYDVDGSKVVTAPAELGYVAFLIAQIPYDLSSGGSTVAFINPTGRSEIINLLGTPLGITGGASGGGETYIPNLTQVLAVGSDAGGSPINNMAEGALASDAATVGQLNTATSNLVSTWAELKALAEAPSAGSVPIDIYVTGYIIVPDGATLSPAQSAFLHASGVIFDGDFTFDGAPIYFDVLNTSFSTVGATLTFLSNTQMNFKKVYFASLTTVGSGTIRYELLGPSSSTPTGTINLERGIWDNTADAWKPIFSHDMTGTAGDGRVFAKHDDTISAYGYLQYRVRVYDTGTGQYLSGMGGIFTTAISTAPMGVYNGSGVAVSYNADSNFLYLRVTTGGAPWRVEIDVLDSTAFLFVNEGLPAGLPDGPSWQAIDNAIALNRGFKNTTLTNSSLEGSFLGIGTTTEEAPDILARGGKALVSAEAMNYLENGNMFNLPKLSKGTRTYTGTTSAGKFNKLRIGGLVDYARFSVELDVEDYSATGGYQGFINVKIWVYNHPTGAYATTARQLTGEKAVTVDVTRHNDGSVVLQVYRTDGVSMARNYSVWCNLRGMNQGTAIVPSVLDSLCTAYTDDINDPALGTKVWTTRLPLGLLLTDTLTIDPNPTFLNGWAVYAGSPKHIEKDGTGMCSIEMLVTGTNATSDTMCVLDSAFWPRTNVEVSSIQTSGTAVTTVTASGNILCTSRTNWVRILVVYRVPN